MRHLTRRQSTFGMGSAALAATLSVSLLAAAAARAAEAPTVQRVDASSVELHRSDSTAVDVWLSNTPGRSKDAVLVSRHFSGQVLRVASPDDRRQYLVLAPAHGAALVVAERVLPLQQGSNFRDLGGYATHDGHHVRWGRVFRSAGMPMLTDRDYTLLGQLALDSVVDLRALPERELAPDLLDDRTGALFLSNDYTLKDLMTHMGQANGNDMYKGLEQLLAPQFRMAVRRMLANRGAVVFHDVWGQDRTGVFAALLLDVLGVDRATIIADYHLSTQVRHTRFEVPKLAPADYPGNPIVAYYASKWSGDDYRPESLYTTGGASHIEQFLQYIDRSYGGSSGYFCKSLDICAADIAQLKAVLLE